MSTSARSVFAARISRNRAALAGGPGVAGVDGDGPR